MSGYRVWECQNCGWIYDEAKGWPEDKIAPGTRWEDIPEDWCGPQCGASKGDFAMLEVTAREQGTSAKKDTSSASPKPGNTFRIWECMVCGWIYDEAKGCPDEGMAPGNRWEDIPEDWSCPQCGVSKEEFDMVLASTVPVDTAPEMATMEDRDPLVIVGTGLAGFDILPALKDGDSYC